MQIEQLLLKKTLSSVTVYSMQDKVGISYLNAPFFSQNLTCFVNAFTKPFDAKTKYFWDLFIWHNVILFNSYNNHSYNY